MATGAAWSSWHVGERVVVRYRRDADDGGPPLSDALGDLVAVSPESLTVRTRRGDVTVPVGRIVGGKRVPPAPVRHPPDGAGPQTTRFHGW